LRRCAVEPHAKLHATLAGNTLQPMYLGDNVGKVGLPLAHEAAGLFEPRLLDAVHLAAAALRT
jgi:hypothetical protein